MSRYRQDPREWLSKSLEKDKQAIREQDLAPVRARQHALEELSSLEDVQEFLEEFVPLARDYEAKLKSLLLDLAYLSAGQFYLRQALERVKELRLLIADMQETATARFLDQKRQEIARENHALYARLQEELSQLRKELKAVFPEKWKEIEDDLPAPKATVSADIPSSLDGLRAIRLDEAELERFLPSGFELRFGVKQEKNSPPEVGAPEGELEDEHHVRTQRR